MNIISKVSTAKNSPQQMYDRARSNLLTMLVLTVVNMIFLVAGSETMMLFSATIPYVSLTLGILSEYEPLLVLSIIFSTLFIVLYLLCWNFSKKHIAWMIVALILFIIDTFVLVGMYLLVQEVSGILDFLIHIWVLYYLVMGVYYGYKLKNQPHEPTPVASASMALENDTYPEN